MLSNNFIIDKDIYYKTLLHRMQFFVLQDKYPKITFQSVAVRRFEWDLCTGAKKSSTMSSSIAAGFYSRKTAQISFRFLSRRKNLPANGCQLLFLTKHEEFSVIILYPFCFFWNNWLWLSTYGQKMFFNNDRLRCVNVSYLFSAIK